MTDTVAHTDTLARAHRHLIEWLAPMKQAVRERRQTRPTPCSSTEPHDATPARLADGTWGAVTFHPQSEWLHPVGTVANLRVRNRSGHIFPKRAVVVAVCEIAAHWTVCPDQVTAAEWAT